MSISPTAQVSISAWVYPRAYEDNKHVISKGSHVNSSYRSYAILGPHQGKKWQFWVNSGWTELMVSSVSDALLNQWNHIVAVYDGSKMKLYINGVFEAEINKAGSINDRNVLLGNVGLATPVAVVQRSAQPRRARDTERGDRAAAAAVSTEDIFDPLG